MRKGSGYVMYMTITKRSLLVKVSPRCLTFAYDVSASTGGLSGSCGLDTLSEGCGLAPLPEHLCGLVCDCPCGWIIQCCYHGYLHVRNPPIIGVILCLPAGEWIVEHGQVCSHLSTPPLF